MTTEAVVAPASGAFRLESALLKRAKQNDTQAIAQLFRQFIAADEEIFYAQYLGVQGVWGIGQHSFACATSRRVASLNTAAFGRVVYQDAYLEYLNSSITYQPSKFLLYVIGVFWFLILGSWLLGGLIGGVASGLTGDFAGGMASLMGLVLSVLGVLAWPLIVQVYYRIKKCGIVYWIREGVPVYIFSNRNKLLMANRLARCITDLRETRIRTLQGSATIGSLLTKTT